MYNIQFVYNISQESHWQGETAVMVKNREGILTPKWTSETRTYLYIVFSIGYFINRRRFEFMVGRHWAYM